jgi:SAM-dependent methyltransferase
VLLVPGVSLFGRDDIAPLAHVMGWPYTGGSPENAHCEPSFAEEPGALGAASAGGLARGRRAAPILDRRRWNPGLLLRALLHAPWIDLLETDVYIGPCAQIVCDGHALPVKDDAFAAVVCQAVLEHVADPNRAAQELHRVLDRAGLVYSELPFAQQVHERAYDFTRWTMIGHRRLLRCFDKIDAGAVSGPGEELAWSLRHFVLALAGDSPLRRGFGMLTTVTTLRSRWLDALLRGRPVGLDAASGRFILGCRRVTPRSDFDIVAAHRGAISSPNR